MICYHTTDAAEEILRRGFRDATGTYMLVGLDEPVKGVFLADRPMDSNEGAKGDQVLKVEFRDDVDLDEFEWVEEGKPYREWFVRAWLINARATVTLMSEDERDGSAT